MCHSCLIQYSGYVAVWQQHTEVASAALKYTQYVWFQQCSEERRMVYKKILYSPVHEMLIPDESC